MSSEPSQASPVVTMPISEVVKWTKGGPISEVVKWTKGGGKSRLFLPPIQRSVVWRNSQIINYWDSLFRGYPAGLMMIHHPKNGALQAITSEGKTCNICANDFELFDGQQRLTAILLGLGEGQLKDRLRLWVDLGAEPPTNSDCRFALRINSTGQPFGYQPSAPNEKPPINKRRDKTEKWVTEKALDYFRSEQAFVEADGSDLIDATCAIPIQKIAGLIQEHEASGASEILQADYPAIHPDHIVTFVQALTRALSTPVLFQWIDQSVVDDEDEYIRFFGRLGQGGTPLTNDELTYSIIKHHFPEVRERMKDIIDGPAGRLASEVNLVLAALRVAKVSAPWDESGNWQIFGRPHPAFVPRLRQLSRVSEEFRRMIPATPGGRLNELLESIRHRLVYDRANNRSGLPVILLARMPHQLVDVLILMESQRTTMEEPLRFLPAFVLYWLLFVIDSEKAADIIFKRFCLNQADWRPNSNQNLIRDFEKKGVSRPLPCLKLLGEARDGIGRGTHLLRSYGERFAELDANKDQSTAETLRALSTNGELIRRTLLWLQREYLSEQFPNYDPTSSRDEDLPIDLDHLIPHTKFGDDWRSQQKRLSFSDDKENFRYLRGTVGNSLGNYRWLDASENRSRQANKIGVWEGEQDFKRDFIKDVRSWNLLIDKTPWSEDDVSEFQKLIDLRTLEVYEELLVSGGLNFFTLNFDEESSPG